MTKLQRRQQQQKQQQKEHSKTNKTKKLKFNKKEESDRFIATSDTAYSLVDGLKNGQRDFMKQIEYNSTTSETGMYNSLHNRFKHRDMLDG